MFGVIAKYASAVAAFGVLTTGSFAVNARSAERAVEIPSVTVRYTDLNLNTPAGVEALYARLRAAARDVCNVGERRPLNAAIAAKTCYRQVLGAAVDNVQSLKLSALHRGESTRGDPT
jgi:UrcA family protein